MDGAGDDGGAEAAPGVEENGGGAGEAMEAVAVDAEASDGDLSDDAVGDDAPETCLWCRERLPEREDLRFCPFCGSSVDVRPCPECGAEVESDWIFCVACGTEAAD